MSIKPRLWSRSIRGPSPSLRTAARDARGGFVFASCSVASLALFCEGSWPARFSRWLRCENRDGLMRAGRASRPVVECHLPHKKRCNSADKVGLFLHLSGAARPKSRGTESGAEDPLWVVTIFAAQLWRISRRLITPEQRGKKQTEELENTLIFLHLMGLFLHFSNPQTFPENDKRHPSGRRTHRVAHFCIHFPLLFLQETFA